MLKIVSFYYMAVTKDANIQSKFGNDFHCVVEECSEENWKLLVTEWCGLSVLSAWPWPLDPYHSKHQQEVHSFDILLVSIEVN